MFAIQQAAFHILFTLWPFESGEFESDVIGNVGKFEKLHHKTCRRNLLTATSSRRLVPNR